MGLKTVYSDIEDVYYPYSVIINIKHELPKYFKVNINIKNEARKEIYYKCNTK